MRIAHEAINSELVDMELIELKFIFDRRTFILHTSSQYRYQRTHEVEALVHHDNRDFSILANYQPRCGASFIDQTESLEKTPGVSHTRVTSPRAASQ